MSQVIADYHGFDYKTKFWGQGREYEDFADRLAIRTCLKHIPSGKKLADICGGYGRLSNEYFSKFSEVILFDYAQNLLDQGKNNYGDKIKTQQGSVYELPFEKEAFDVCAMVRASHHLAEFPKALAEIARTLKPQGCLILEIANKRNVLEIIRYFLGRSNMEPFSLEPKSRNEKGFYNYHPAYIENLFKQNNLKVKKVLFVSFFRLPILKKIFGSRVLSLLERVAQPLLGWLKLSPSIYYLVQKQK